VFVFCSDAQEKREVRLKLEKLESEILKILGTNDIHLVHSQAVMTQLIAVKEGYDDANIRSVWISKVST
jgi:hypothetical protein